MRVESTMLSAPTHALSYPAQIFGQLFKHRVGCRASQPQDFGFGPEPDLVEMKFEWLINAAFDAQLHYRLLQHCQLMFSHLTEIKHRNVVVLRRNGWLKRGPVELLPGMDFQCQ